MATLNTIQSQLDTIIAILTGAEREATDNGNAE
jgi:hypothetical protein